MHVRTHTHTHFAYLRQFQHQLTSRHVEVRQCAHQLELVVAMHELVARHIELRVVVASRITCTSQTYTLQSSRVAERGHVPQLVVGQIELAQIA
jgi:hypothetical protein